MHLNGNNNNIHCQHVSGCFVLLLIKVMFYENCFPFKEVFFDTIAIASYHSELLKESSCEYISTYIGGKKLLMGFLRKRSTT